MKPGFGSQLTGFPSVPQLLVIRIRIQSSHIFPPVRTCLVLGHSPPQDPASFQLHAMKMAPHLRIDYWASRNERCNALEGREVSRGALRERAEQADLPHTPSPLTSASSPCGPAERVLARSTPRGGAAPGLFPHLVCRGLRSPPLLAREKTQLDAPQEASCQRPELLLQELVWEDWAAWAPLCILGPPLSPAVVSASSRSFWNSCTLQLFQALGPVGSGKAGRV